MANKPNPADFSPAVPDFPVIGQYHPIYGKFDLTTYIQGASDYEIMSFLVQCYNATLKGYSDVTQLSKDTVTAYNQLQTWVNTWFDNLDVKKDVNEKLEQMRVSGELATVIASSEAMTPAIYDYFASQDGNTKLSNLTSNKIDEMAANGTLTNIVKATGQINPAVTAYLNSTEGTQNLSNVTAKKIEEMAANGTLTNIVKATGQINPSVTAYLNSTDGTQNLSNATAKKIEEMADNGELGTIISKTADVQKTTTDWLSHNVTPVGSAVVVDKSLSIEGAAADAKETGIAKSSSIQVFNHLVITKSDLADLNNANGNGVYVLAVTNTNPPANLPPNYPLTGTTGLLETVKVPFYNSYTTQQRLKLLTKDYLYYREYVGTKNEWTPWEKFYNSSQQVKIYIGSSREYKTLKEGLEEAIKHNGCEVYVDAETFDVVAEYGEDFFNNFTLQTGIFGLALGNDIKIHFASGSKVICNYEGSNNVVKKEFSVFHTYQSSSGFVLDNATIVCKNVRYCVHDEHATSSTPYKNVYENCSMYIDNSKNPVWGPDTPCIGGGLGQHGEIIVENCVFEATGSTERTGVISYHNSASSVAKSNLVFRNNYFKGNNAGLRFGYYGTSTEITTILISGNSYSLEPVLRAENASATVNNMSILKFGNELRA